MENSKVTGRRNSTAHLLIGIVLVMVGLAVIAEIFDAFPWRIRDFLFSWQMILIVLGVIFISGKDSKTTGYILLAIGLFFLLPRMFHMPDYWRSLFWPVMLILLGFVVIFHRGKRPHMHASKMSEDDMLDDVGIFGGSDKIVNSSSFKGGKITHVFGGSKYDFSRAKLAEGTHYLEVVLIFGGTKFIVPDDWDVRMEITSVFGGFSDKRRRSVIVIDSSTKLILTGVSLFGGGEITNL